MAADFKIKYPSTSTISITCTSASLASDTALLAGRASTAVDNTSNLDLDHLVSGVLRVSGTSPTASTTIELWIYAPTSISSGTPTYPDSITGTDANKTMTSANVKVSALKLLTVITVDSTASRDYFIAPASVANLFGGQLPTNWGIFLVQGTGQALNATQVALQYHRVQAQSV